MRITRISMDLCTCLRGITPPVCAVVVVVVVLKRHARDFSHMLSCREREREREAFFRKSMVDHLQAWV